MRGTVAKRLIDILGAVLGLLVLLPLIILISIAIYIFDGAPVLFTQQRAGLNGRPFTIYKFRTMRVTRGDPEKARKEAAQRITPLGRILRNTSLDELPQLFNVLKGDMSLVGPRPLHVEYVPLYNARQRIRLKMKPGITGWAQINGRNALSWEERFELDAWYVENWSLALDFKILFKTIVQVIKREGIGGKTSEIPPRFRGNPEEKPETDADMTKMNEIVE